MSTTKIEWASNVWNPLAGCSLASPGCAHCYAMKMAGRLEAMGMEQYQGTTQKAKAGFVWTGQVNPAPESILTAPLRRKKPTDYFVNSMSDLFHPAVPDELIDRVFAVMALSPQHVFKILTKRPDRMREYCSDDRTSGRIARVIIDWLLDKVIAWRELWPVRSIGDIDDPTDLALTQWPLPNVWLGTSVEDQTRADERIHILRETPAAIRFISFEPLLSAVQTDLTGIHWAIIGSESGRGAREMNDLWAHAIVDQCEAAGTAVFVKQLSSGGPKAIKDITQFPKGLQVREFPA